MDTCYAEVEQKNCKGDGQQKEEHTTCVREVLRIARINRR